MVETLGEPGALSPGECKPLPVGDSEIAALVDIFGHHIHQSINGLDDERERIVLKAAWDLLQRFREMLKTRGVNPNLTVAYSVSVERLESVCKALAAAEHQLLLEQQEWIEAKAILIEQAKAGISVFARGLLAENIGLLEREVVVVRKEVEEKRQELAQFNAELETKRNELGTKGGRLAEREKKLDLAEADLNARLTKLQETERAQEWVEKKAKQARAEADRQTAEAIRLKQIAETEIAEARRLQARLDESEQKTEARLKELERVTRENLEKEIAGIRFDLAERERALELKEVGVTLEKDRSKGLPKLAKRKRR